MHESINAALASRIAGFDLAAARRSFVDQDEFLLIEDFLPAAIVSQLLGTLPGLDGAVHRNFIPRHKKGGSVGRHDLDRLAPLYNELYRAPALQEFLGRLCDRRLFECPPADPHTYALYYYTEPGDHIGYHYDTSYYKGARYTVLIGMVSAPSCQLEYELHTRNPARANEHASVELTPGALVLFNGDKLYHRITPLADNERRVALTLEYLTDTHMNPLLRFVSNMKDAIAYFGFRQVFSRGERNAAGS